MKKSIILLALSVLIAGYCCAQGFTVKNLHVEINISKDGYFDVEEKYNVDFSEDKHGLWREIPYIYVVKNTDGSEKTTSVDISNIDVPGWPFHKSFENGNVSIKVGDADKYVIGDQQYTIKYRVKYAFLYNDTTTQFYWNFLGRKWMADFENVSFSIHLPEYLPLANKDYFVYTGLPGQNDDSASISYNHGTVSGTSKEVLGNGKDLTVLINLPAGFVAKPSKLAMLIAGWGWMLFPLLLILVYYLLWRKIGRDNKIIKVVEFQPPPGIDPAMAGFLINDSSDASDLTALIPHWGAYGYITIEQVAKKGLFSHSDTILHKIKPLPASAPNYESTLFEGLFASGDDVSMNSLKNIFYKTMEDAKAKLKKSAMAGDYYTKSSNNSGCLVSLGIIVIGGIGYYFLNLAYGQPPAIVWAIVCIILILCSRIFMKRTGKGDEAMQHIIGFKMFIEKAEKDRLEVLLKEDPTYFEKTIGYALAFGMLTAWGRKFDGLDVPAPTWYIGYSGYMFSPYSFSQNFNDSISSAQTNMVSAPSSSGGGSGFSGGGSSGGGFGGGGGGSW